jgi:hypothetical protein
MTKYPKTGEPPPSISLSLLDSISESHLGMFLTTKNAMALKIQNEIHFIRIYPKGAKKGSF